MTGWSTSSSSDEASGAEPDGDGEDEQSGQMDRHLPEVRHTDRFVNGRMR
jgi:hypothetical protein